MKNKFTKTGIIFVLAFIFTNLINAQNYMITFSGSGQSNVVETVEVKNIAQQTSLTLSGSQTLQLVNVVGISTIHQEYAGMNVYPNPSSHTSQLEFYNSEAGSVVVEIIEITGKALISFSVNLSRGLQAFEIQGLGTGIYLLKATTGTTVHQQRLITYSQSFGNPQINYLGSFDLSLVPPETKSTKNIIAMQYNDGERLVIKGSSGVYSHTISLIPSESQNIDFEFIECVDSDGNHYPVVTIGEQIWMAENLKTTKYSNADPIDNPILDEDWQTNNTGAYTYYNNDITWKEKYGLLYNWFAVNNTNGLCPAGWHVPSDAEWTQLIDYVVSQGFPNQWDNPDGAGNVLKSCRQVSSYLGGDCETDEHPRWNAHGTHYGTDAFGFEAFPSDMRTFMGNYGNIGEYGDYWSSTEESTPSAWARFVDYNSGAVGKFNQNKRSGLAVRCVQD